MCDIMSERINQIESKKYPIQKDKQFSDLFPLRLDTDFKVLVHHKYFGPIFEVRSTFLDDQMIWWLKNKKQLV